MAIKGERTLDYVKITGPGVDALEHRKEHNNNAQVSAEQLSGNINKVKRQNFEGLKALTKVGRA